MAVHYTAIRTWKTEKENSGSYWIVSLIATAQLPESHSTNVLFNNFFRNSYEFIFIYSLSYPSFHV